MASAAKAYLVEFGIAMAAYIILLLIAMTLVQNHPAAPWRFAVVLIPLIPLIFVLVAMLRFFSRIDELARKIHLDAIAVAAGVTAIATFGYGLLETVGLPTISLLWVFPFTIAVWGIATAVASAKYR